MEEILELEETYCGMHISTACQDAVNLADKENEPVHFKFNDTDVIACPGENPAEVVDRWNADREAAYQEWINSDEYKQRGERLAAEAKAAREAHMVETAQTETEMRDAKVPWPLTKEQLVEYIESLVNRPHEYGTAVYALSMAAEAAFNYVAGLQGATGFQASCADLDFIKRTRGLKGPFMLLRAEDALYPQYDLREKLEEALTSWKPWLKEEATKNLADKAYAHPNVIRHWEKLAK